MVLRSITGTTVEALESDGDRLIVPTTIELADIDPQALEVTHYYGLDEVHYEGIGEVALGLGTKWPYVWLHLGRFADALGQRRFNSRPLLVGERLDILRDVMEATARGTDAVGALDLMSHRYGYRWAGHPDWNECQQRLDRQLALLAEAGDLATNDHFTYRPTGQGLRTLDERTDAARKHDANWRVQVLAVVAAIAAAVFAAAQAGFFKSSTSSDTQPGGAAKTASSPSLSSK